MDWSKVQYFEAKEFCCHCGCGYCEPHPQLVAILDEVRREYGHRIVIHSGCRCEAHNEIVDGKKNSAHLRGYAVDIRCMSSLERARLLPILQQYFSRIGIAKSFIHVDLDPDLPADVTWVY